MCFLSFEGLNFLRRALGYEEGEIIDFKNGSSKLKDQFIEDNENKIVKVNTDIQFHVDGRGKYNITTEELNKISKRISEYERDFENGKVVNITTNYSMYGSSGGGCYAIIDLLFLMN